MDLTNQSTLGLSCLLADYGHPSPEISAMAAAHDKEKQKGIPHLYLLSISALIGAIYGPLICHLACEARGHSAPEVMEAVALRNSSSRWMIRSTEKKATKIATARTCVFQDIGGVLSLNKEELC
jgi:H+/Cl- antiporter ClcA